MKKEILKRILNDNKNLIVSGDISVGKTSNVLFPLVREMIDEKQSLLVLDSKEEYIKEYYDDLKSKDYNIVILNLRNLSKSEGWNPLEYPYNLYKDGKVDEAINYIEKQAKAIFYDDSEVDQFWSNNSSDFYTGIVLGLFEDGKDNEINLSSVNSMFNSTDNKYSVNDYVTQYFKLKNPSSQSYIFASSTISAPKETKGGIISVARQKLRTYVTREMLSTLLNKTTFSYEDILTKPTAIFVIARDENKYINNVATMFIEQLFTILVNSKIQNQFNFVLDNIDDLERVNELSDMLSSGVSRNIKFEIATRSYEELIEKYGKYIEKLSNHVVVEKDIKLVIDNEEYTEEKEQLIEFIQDENVEFPLLQKEKIEMFNIVEFVRSKKEGIDMSNPFLANNLSTNVPDINGLIKDIDRKIEQLDAKENTNSDASVYSKEVEEHNNMMYQSLLNDCKSKYKVLEASNPIIKTAYERAIENIASSGFSVLNKIEILLEMYKFSIYCAEKFLDPRAESRNKTYLIMEVAECKTNDQLKELKNKLHVTNESLKKSIDNHQEYLEYSINPRYMF